MRGAMLAVRCCDLGAPRRMTTYIGIVIFTLGLGSGDVCAEQKKLDRPHAVDAPLSGADLQLFCGNNAASIGDARIAWQTHKLRELEERVQKRLAELDRKKAEYEEWLRRRDDMLKQAADGVVSIYSKMRPEAAALQLAAMEEQAAAAILAKMPPRTSSAILNEMEVARAAHLTRLLSGPELQNEKKS